LSNALHDKDISHELYIWNEEATGQGIGGKWLNYTYRNVARTRDFARQLFINFRWLKQ
jgi:hypothetical protein